jgi:TRAP-type C4-dicarboxylate transport system permease small subunit
VEGGQLVRIEASPRHRGLATAAQVVLLAVIAGLAWVGARLVSALWADRADPQVLGAIWLAAAVLATAGLTLAWLMVLVQDLVKATIEVGPKGITVDRLLGGFTAGWDEVREVGLVAARGHLTLRTAQGTVTLTERLFGRAAFGTLVAALRAHAGPAVREWTPWAAARRQLVLFAIPAVALGMLLYLAQGFLRARTRRPR